MSHEDVHDAFRASVVRVAEGADPMEEARAAGTGKLRRSIATVLTEVAARLPRGEADARDAARVLTDLRERDPTELGQADQSLLDANGQRDLSDLGGWAFEFAVGSARAARFAWSDNGPPGYDPATSVVTLLAWSAAAIALGRTFAWRCRECGTPLADRRAPGSDGRTVRRVYCGAHDHPATASLHVKTEKEIERLAAEIARALEADLRSR
jgi:hypothetical protein